MHISSTTIAAIANNPSVCKSSVAQELAIEIIGYTIVVLPLVLLIPTPASVKIVSVKIELRTYIVQLATTQKCNSVYYKFLGSTVALHANETGTSHFR